MATPLLVDTDPGIDDALALLAAWNSPEVVVEVVTTVAGNVTVEQATTNVCRLLALRKPDPAPVVAIGAPDPLARQLVTATRYHGADGLGDLDDWPAVGRGELAAAVPLILDRARRQQRLLTIVALGPMTNLALALKADPAAMKFVGRVVAMGGAVDVPGNVTPAAEFNMYVDPEAAHRVLAAGLSLDLVPLDATRQAVLPRAGLKKALSRAAGPLAARLPLHLVPLDATRQAVLPRAGIKSAFRRVSGPLADRIVAFSERGFRIDHASGSQGLVLHDPLALALAIDPTLAEWESVRLVIGPDGETLRASGEPNCRIAKRIDADRFLRLFLDRLCPPSLRRRASS